MVSCDVEGNLKIRVKDGSSVWWLSILVFNHRVGIDKLEISENGGSSWTEVTRADYNEFEISRQPGNELQLPLIVRVTGFTDDQISIDLPAIEGDEIIDSGSQFPAVPEGYGGSSNQCCSPQDEFTVVYEDSLGLGWMDGSWGTTNNFAYTQSTHDGSKCIQSVINAWGGLQLLNNVGGPSDQYESLDFWIKASQAIDSGISVWLDDKVHVTTPAVTTSWQLFSFNMTVLDPDERIFGFSVQNGNTALTLYFDSIEFVIDPDAPTTKECADGVEGGTSLGISVSPVYALCAFCICCLILASSSLL
ncbi:swollenin/expansin family protein [Pelomyxa schiedti]|nr:swollenin/expansin family protein [Pelomyxa schiedti]